MRLFHTDHNPDGSVERWYSDAGGNITRKVEQRVDGIHDAIKAAVDAGMHKTKTSHYLGSIPMVIASQWAKECGSGIGTKEFGEYAKKKLMSGDYSKLSTGLRA